MALTPVTVVARIRAKPGMQEKVKQHLLKLIAPTRAEKGCLNYDLHQSVDDPALFLFYENWIDKKSLEDHLKKPHLNTFREKAEAMLAEPVEIGTWEMVSVPK